MVLSECGTAHCITYLPNLYDWIRAIDLKFLFTGAKAVVTSISNLLLQVEIDDNHFLNENGDYFVIENSDLC